jgi:predicted nucleic acid-binding protein
MKVVLDTNVLVSAALKQKSMPGMTPAYSNRSQPNGSYSKWSPARILTR